MCGICGIFEFIEPSPHTQHILAKMNKTLIHRGPNDTGIYIDGPIALGHRRLSILDLSPAGHQPMASHDQNFWIVYNGEIYNYRELKSELETLGYHFKTGTDTEVILAAYQAYGPDCLKKFNGMWAFAIWDQHKQILFCSRDRFGIKPFYYFHHSDCFVFASEIKALLQHPASKKNIDSFVSYRFLSMGQSNIGSESFFSDIRQLKPGHYLMINQNNVEEYCYWDLEPEFSDAPLSLQSAQEQLQTLFIDSVHLQMRSDVAIGTCLSGGIDSSAIVCIAHQLSQKYPNSMYQQATFSSCFEDKRFDEREFIELVIKQTKANKNYVFPEPEQFLEDLTQLVYTQDEPFSSLSIFAQWCVMKKAKEQGISVLLDGQGADELLAGYGYDSIYWSELLNQKNDWQLLPQEIRASLNKYGINTTIYRLGSTLFPPSFKEWKKRSETKKFISDEINQKYNKYKFFKEKKQKFKQKLKNELYNEIKNRLPSLLRYEDRNSMAFSLESRVPFLDHRLVEFIFSLPDKYIIHEGWSKWIFRKAMQGIIPENIRWRKDKMGFVTPQTEWYKHELFPFINEILNDQQFQQRPYWNGKTILKSYQKYLRYGDPTITSFLWRCISMELWLRSL